MVLTRRAYKTAMEAFRWLPNELLVHIIQYSATADQASLSRVSRLFHELCLPALYHIVHIQHSDAVDLFCSAVIDNPSRAAAVRSFTVNVCRHRHPPRQHLILAALKLMSTLDHLSLSSYALDPVVDDIHQLPLLEEYNFSELTGVLHIKTLRLECQHTQDTVRRMTACLPRFTSLVYLAMDSSNLYSLLTTKDMDRPIVKGWGKACPTLEACCLNHSAWRKVDGRWKVFPVKEFRALAGLPEIRC
ncbi:hypothetical protein C8R45DRAFT_1082019 [Mycena sanguinolenta]|nr:hypothetical protein C8R45DRAFT_1082019 [Mycena sanguinolenta]